MSSGIPGDLMSFFLPYSGSIGATVGNFITAPLMFEPGSQFYYSNPNFVLASYFVEKFSGMSFEQYLTQHIFDVVGLKNTYYDPYNGKFGLDKQRVGEYFRYLDPTTKAPLTNGLCSSEYDLGAMAGAAGIVSTQADEALLYFTLFNFSNPATMGQPLLQKPQSLLDIVKSRTLVENNLYFAQGLFVNADALNAFPTVIQYEGEIVCSHTLNYLNLTVSPPTLVQVWSAVPVAYVTQAELHALAAARTGNFFEIIMTLPKRKTVIEIAQEIVALFLKKKKRFAPFRTAQRRIF